MYMLNFEVFLKFGNLQYSVKINCAKLISEFCSFDETVHPLNYCLCMLFRAVLFVAFLCRQSFSGYWWRGFPHATPRQRHDDITSND